MRTIYLFMLMGFFIIGCTNASKKNESTTTEEPARKEIYEAQITPLNENVTKYQPSGKARFEIDGETIHVSIEINNAPPSMEHWQHFHGFEDGSDAKCATIAEDKNGDRIIDVIETEAVSGTTMVPFNKFPSQMEIPTDTYPVADENGSYQYHVTIPLADLQKAFSDAFGGHDLNLDKRVIYIHGVPSTVTLPNTVASIGDIPAHVTLPIACGKIEKVNR